jgi:hypothetical protein
MRADYEAFHRAHPEVWEMFERFALQKAREHGRTHYGAKSVMERVRWETEAGGGEPFSINNNWTAFYARRFVHVAGWTQDGRLRRGWGVVGVSETMKLCDECWVDAWGHGSIPVYETARGEAPAAPDFAPFVAGEYHRPDYYKPRKRNPRISDDADVEDVVHAWDLDAQVAEIVRHALRCGRKPGESKAKELTNEDRRVGAEGAFVSGDGGEGMNLDLEGIQDLKLDHRGRSAFFVVVFEGGQTVLTDFPWSERPIADIIQCARAHKHEMDEIDRRRRAMEG